MNERLTTRDLAEVLAIQTGMDKKRADIFIGVLSSYISQCIEKNKIVRILGLGTFKIVLVRERESVHIQTGERFVIPAHHKLSFIPDKDFKEHINRPFAFFEPIEAVEEHKPQKVSIKKDYYEESKQVEEDISPIVDEVEEIYDITESAFVAPVIANAENTIENDYFSAIGYDLSSLEDNDEEFIQQEPEFEPELQEDKVSDEYSETVSIDDSDDDNDMDKGGIINTDSVGNTESIYISNTSGKRKSTAPMLILWFLVVPLLIFLGSGLATYLFLHYNTDKSLNNNQPFNISAYDPETTGDALFPLGSTSDSVYTNITDMVTMSDGFFLPDSSSKEGTEGNNGDSTEINTSTKREERIDFNWFTPSPESTKTEQRRADRPNEEIERRNRELARTSNLNTRTTTPSDNRGTTAAGNTARETTTTTGTTSTQTAEREKIIPATIRLTAGSSLRQIAEEYYGDRVFWVYIYEYNKERINNYNNIPVGTEIRMPLPRTYGINSKNASSIQRAEQKQSELYRSNPNN